jgi:succinate-acetate transporter protein
MFLWTLMLGATTQLVAALVDCKRSSMFGTTAFTTYSLLWYAISHTLSITIYKGAKFDITQMAVSRSRFHRLGDSYAGA